jgi:hypothetical protein
MGFYKHIDKKSGDGLALTEWNTLSTAVAGNSGLTLALAADDKVGIGVLNPAAKLQVMGGAIMPEVGDRDSAGILFPKDPAGGSGDKAYIRYYARSGEAMTLKIGIENEADDHIALMPSGNVGIGTDNPDQKLTVQGSLNVGGRGDGQILVKKVNGKGSDSSADHLLLQFNNGKDVNIGGGADANLNVNGKIYAKGNVGIGMVPAAEKLEVSGKVKATHFIGDGSALTNVGLNGLNLATLSGNVGIGTATPSAKLEVNGTLKATQYLGINLVWGAVQQTVFINDFDGIMDFKLPDGCVMVGLWSEHNNNKEDRVFRIYYRSLGLSGI